ncbi:MAG: HXXEE domain-containing protein [bacterium]|nr:HXXEE domain-containing protein [bacterium]
MISNLINKLKSLPLRTIVWVFPVIFLFHELEEWNIMEWYNRFYIDMPPSTDLSVRIWMIGIGITGFLLTGLALRFKNTKITAYLMVPLIAFTVSNGLQHIYWLFLFKAYAPGVIFGGFLGVTAGIYLIYRTVREDLVKAWFPVLFVPYIVHVMAGTVQAGNTLSPSIRAIHELMINVLACL